MEQHAVVLMSTYNGQQYLTEQLDSIFAQTWQGMITVLIRDDGSKDDTISLIETYSQMENRKILLYKCVNTGPQRSFLELIRIAEDADYYFFADQDDVWDLDKLDVAIRAMEQYDVPVSYCSNFRHAHMNLEVYEERALAQRPKFSPLQIIFYNQIPGCVMGFNRKLMLLLKQLQLVNVMMHDSMALSLAALCGEVIYDEKPRITHRIHLANVVGHGHKKIIPHKWIKEKLMLVLHKENYDLSEMARQFLELAGDTVHTEYAADISLLQDYKKSWRNTRLLLKHPDSQGIAWDRTTLSIRFKIGLRLF